MAGFRDERDEVIDRYLSVKRSRTRRAGAELAREPLDPIEPSLIARIKVRALFGTKSVLRVFTWMACLGVLLGESSPVEVRPRPDFVTPVGVAQWFASKVPELITLGLLMEVTDVAPKALCGLFGVLKPGKGLRVIFNAKPANEVLKPLPGAQLQIFRLEDLITQYVRLARKGPVYFLNIDYRH